jgi:hypothetical protein
MKWFHTLAEPFCEAPECRCRTGVYADIMRNPERKVDARLRAIKIMNDSARLTHAFYASVFPETQK